MSSFSSHTEIGIPFFFKKKVIFISIILGIGSFLLFAFIPEIDIAVTRYFYAGNEVNVVIPFPLSQDPYWMRLRKIMLNIPIILAIGMAVLSLFSLPVFSAFKWRLRLPYRAMLFAIISFIIIVLLIVDQGLKDSLGRVRPDGTLLFGGEYLFEALGQFPGKCANNCSFVSGEVSSAVWMMLVLPLLFSRFHAVIYSFAIAFLFTTIYVRVGFGRHFLSDAIFAFFIPHWVMSLFYWLGYRRYKDEKYC